MIRPRIIPILLIASDGIVKTTKFKNPTYVGDPINTIKIFNEKGVDEIIVLDINATSHQRDPNFQFIQELGSECFMPFCYGGGLKNIKQIEKVFYSGAEKISLNYASIHSEKLIEDAANIFGSQAIVVSMDIKKDLFGKYKLMSERAKISASKDIVAFAKKVESLGAGEILLNSVDNDGVQGGYDLKLITQVSESVSIPVVACGGLGCFADIQLALDAGASAVSGGSFFIFVGKHRAVLVTYPSEDSIKTLRFPN